MIRAAAADAVTLYIISSYIRCPLSWYLLQFQIAMMESLVKSFKESLLSGLKPQEEWTRLADMTSARRSFAAVALDDG